MILFIPVGRFVCFAERWWWWWSWLWHLITKQSEHKTLQICYFLIIFPVSSQFTCFFLIYIFTVFLLIFDPFFCLIVIHGCFMTILLLIIYFIATSCCFFQFSTLCPIFDTFWPFYQVFFSYFTQILLLFYHILLT